MTALNDDRLLDSDAPPVEVRGLVSRFDHITIHNNLDLVVNRGEIVGVVGGSGTGKSVLLNTIIGLKQPDAGEIYFNNKRLGSIGQVVLWIGTAVVFKPGYD